MVAGSSRVAVTAVLALALIAPACGHAAPPGVEPQVTGPPPQHLVVRLEDERHPLADGRVAWRTWWELCWDPYPGARSYEVQVVTGEGVSPRLREQTDRCIRTEAAAGEDSPEALEAKRTTLLVLQEGQLADQVRAVTADDRRSEWTPPQPVGVEDSRAQWPG